MALYAIGDLHLSLNSDKSMEVFGPAWENYTERIQASLSELTAEDVLVLAGDTSWGMTLEELLVLNPQIKNPNVIQPGQRLRVRG